MKYDPLNQRDDGWEPRMMDNREIQEETARKIREMQLVEADRLRRAEDRIYEKLFHEEDADGILNLTQALRIIRDMQKEVFK